MDREKVLVLASGGLDSTILLKYVEHLKYQPTAISIFYGQNHSCEVVALTRIVRSLDINVIYKNLSSVFNGMNSELLDGKVSDIPFRDQIGSTYVPMRNTIFLSVAAGIAESLGIRKVYYGAHAEDAENNYPDCSVEYFRQMHKLVDIATNGRVQLCAPFIDFRKANIVVLGHQLEAPMHLSWSCYRGGKFHCGTCPTCVARKESFRLAGVGDPTIYLK